MPTKNRLANLIMVSIVIAISLITATSCSQHSIHNRTQKQGNHAPPKISNFYDIGHISQVDQNTDLSKLGDQRFSPGEHILLNGKDLLNASVTIDALPASVISTSVRSLIVKIPAHLDMLKTHQLAVTTSLGSDRTEFKSSHYIIGTDTDGNKHYLMRTNPDIKGYIDEEILQIQQTRPLFNHISRDGSILYGIGVASKVLEPASTNNASEHPQQEEKYGLEIKVLHLNTPGEPKEIHTAGAQLNSAPVAIDFSHDKIGVILAKHDIAIFDISNTAAPQQIAHHKLPLNHDNTVYLDALLLSDAKQLVVLETYENKVLLYDITDPSKLQLLHEIKLLPEITTAYSVDLIRNKNTPNKFWVLTGKNLRDLSARTRHLINSVFNKDSDTYINKTNASLIPIAANTQALKLEQAITLPESINPFFGVHHEQHIYISAVHASLFEDFSEESNWLKKIRGLIFNSTRFGKIYKIDLQTGKSDITAEGLGIYFHLALTDTLGPVFTLSKLKGSLSMPYVKPAWGMGMQTRGTYALRKMGIKTLYPPYSLGYISVQY